MKMRLSDVKPRSRPIDFKRMFHSLQFNFIENFMPWLRLSNLWLLTMGSQGEAKGKPRGSQGEAKCYTKEFMGNQEAKGR